MPPHARAQPVVVSRDPVLRVNPGSPRIFCVYSLSCLDSSTGLFRTFSTLHACRRLSAFSLYARSRAHLAYIIITAVTLHCSYSRTFTFRVDRFGPSIVAALQFPLSVYYPHLTRRNSDNLARLWPLLRFSFPSHIALGCPCSCTVRPHLCRSAERTGSKEENRLQSHLICPR
ncbi:hypothetical protein OH77DRAFT_455572 [Trametes cingulata]|nr:hypothetical protein OH77DRAFT_455572 [Trametes cingulata]